ncbi:MAG: hypothetical protein JAY84_10915, partial [Candidatus Thiodiazotropha taylori]|nr:hypothetical protein [Candidatus Thiodiazotropha taylori]
SDLNIEAGAASPANAVTDHDIQIFHHAAYHRCLHDLVDIVSVTRSLQIRSLATCASLDGTSSTDIVAPNVNTE